MSVRLERLAQPGTAQFEEVFSVCCKAPNYWMLTEGKYLLGRDAITAWFDGSMLPAGRTLADQEVYGIRHGNELIGLVMLLKRWRYPDEVTIGLLLLAETWQGQGYGRDIYTQIEQIVRAWPGVTTLRIGVIATNEPAFPFWRKMGFAETGERKRDLSFIADMVVLEKPLYRATV